MKHLGDICRIDGGIAPVDVIIGGSPCQDLSIAGKRQGLSGERSGLFMEQIRLIKEMHIAYGTNSPRYMVWENVPGALSSNKGEDFRVVLESIVNIKEPNAVIPQPPKGKWNNNGCIMGTGWSVAWRILDAQFWGVPQRRRRIALVADFGGQSAPEVLFERKSVSGGSQESREKGKDVTRYPQNSSNSAITMRIRGGCDGGEKGALIQTDKSGTLGCNNDQYLFDARGNGTGKICPTITGDHQSRITDYTAVVLESNDSQKIGIGFDGYNSQITGNISSTLGVNCGVSTGRNGVICLNDQGGQVINVSHDVSGTLRAQMGGHPPVVCQRQNTQSAKAYSFDSLSSNSMKSNNPYSGCREVDISKTLDTTTPNPAKNQGGIGIVNVNYTKDNSRFLVRRLTPLECERLQGFPDNWTDIGDFTTTTGKRRTSSDTVRYQALGNSIALPPWRYVLSKLSQQYQRPATMGSLFDGIGGFPLIWEELNGKGTCLWASEIEEFPMAVTKQHFES